MSGPKTYPKNISDFGMDVLPLNEATEEAKLRVRRTDEREPQRSLASSVASSRFVPASFGYSVVMFVRYRSSGSLAEME